MIWGSWMVWKPPQILTSSFTWHNRKYVLHYTAQIHSIGDTILIYNETDLYIHIQWLMRVFNENWHSCRTLKFLKGVELVCIGWMWPLIITTPFLHHNFISIWYLDLRIYGVNPFLQITPSVKGMIDLDLIDANTLTTWYLALI